jgi:hypothetical protein
MEETCLTFYNNLYMAQPNTPYNNIKHPRSFILSLEKLQIN